MNIDKIKKIERKVYGMAVDRLDYQYHEHKTVNDVTFYISSLMTAGHDTTPTRAYHIKRADCFGIRLMDATKNKELADGILKTLAKEERQWQKEFNQA